MKNVVIIILAVVVIGGGAALVLANRNDKKSTSTTPSSSSTSSGNMQSMSSGSGSSTSQPVSTNSVGIKDFAFSPDNITVKKGTTVTWTNEDGTAHTVTADSGQGPDSGT